MAVVLLCLAAGIKAAYAVRNRTVSGFALQEAAIEAVYTEKTWLDDDPENAGKAARASMGSISGLSSSSMDISGEGNSITACYSGPDGEREIEIGLRDPENYIRLNVLTDIITEEKDADGS